MRSLASSLASCWSRQCLGAHSTPLRGIAWSAQERLRLCTLLHSSVAQTLIVIGSAKRKKLQGKLGSGPCAFGASAPKKMVPGVCCWEFQADDTEGPGDVAGVPGSEPRGGSGSISNQHFGVSVWGAPGALRCSAPRKLFLDHGGGCTCESKVRKPRLRLRPPGDPDPWRVHAKAAASRRPKPRRRERKPKRRELPREPGARSPGAPDGVHEALLAGRMDLSAKAPQRLCCGSAF